MINFVYRTIQLDELSSGHTQVLAYWNLLKGEKFAPSWAEFDMMKIPFHLLPSTNIVDIIDGGRDYLFRFYGTRLCEIHGEELTGKFISDLQPQSIADAIRGSYELSLEKRIPMAQRTDTGASTLVKFQVSLRLPLSDDGETISHLVSIVEYDQDTRELRDRINAAIEQQA